MMEIKYFPPASFPEEDYDDHNIPEIDMPKPTNATDVIPDEVPRRDGPGGE
ncbi:MAG: AE-binding protein [Candidatus Ruminococcus intestinipullorum]|nr:AE-binding protein [Candidatus Ruminococcus intestinipullorum]